MPERLDELWVYLSATPLLGLTLTLLAYQSAYWLYRRAGDNPLLNPVLVAVTMLVLPLVTGTRYQTCFDGAQFVHFLLGPATVALAIPLYTQFVRVRAMLLPIGAGRLRHSASRSPGGAQRNPGPASDLVPESRVARAAPPGLRDAPVPGARVRTVPCLSASTSCGSISRQRPCWDSR